MKKTPPPSLHRDTIAYSEQAGGVKGSGQLAICAADDDGGDDERQRVGDGEGIKQAAQPEKARKQKGEPHAEDNFAKQRNQG